MRVFITGATGFIGSATTRSLIAAGHQVLGLTRSDAGGAALKAAGAEVHHGALEDLESLKSGAAAADAVIHTAFNHDFSRYVQSCKDDRVVVEALGSVLVGTAKPLLVTSGAAMAMAKPGMAATEDDAPAPSSVLPRAASEEAADAVRAKGVNVSIVRLPQVHDTEKAGLITPLIEISREKKLSAYVGDGQARWAAAHISDVADLYCRAIEAGVSGAVYNAVGEEGVTLRVIAEIIGCKLGIPVRSLTPEEAPAHFGWLAFFAGHDAPVSSDITQQRLGWKPKGPGLVEDLEAMKMA